MDALEPRHVKLPPRRHGERLTEQRNPRTKNIDRASIAEALAMIHAEDRICFEISEAVASRVAEAIELVVAAFTSGGRLIYVGAGTSGRLGVLDAAEQPPTFGVEPELVQGIISGGTDALVRSVEGAEDNADDGVAAIDRATVTSNDVVMGIATGGRTPFVLAALLRARELGATTIFLSCTPALDGEEKLADCQIHALVGPEAITGSTRMKAGTVTKLILNQITTVAMVRTGKVYENLMVDVKPNNSKLVDRQIRILQELTGVGREEALDRLEDGSQDLKVALVLVLAGCSADQARNALHKEGGQVSAAVRTILDS